jgi:hypothetical protein
MLKRIAPRKNMPKRAKAWQDFEVEILHFGIGKENALKN